MNVCQQVRGSSWFFLGSFTRWVHISGLLLLTAITGTFGSLRGQDLPGQIGLQAFERAPFDLDRFTQQSDVIVHGIVSSKEAKWMDKTLYTYYELVVRETIQGTAQSSVTVAVLGGTLGNVGLAIPDAPDLRVGDEIVFFGKSFEGQRSFKPVGLGAGVIRTTPGSDGQTRFVTTRGRAEGLDGFLDQVRSKKP